MAASLETNKTLAALLTAGIIASGAGVISRILYHPSMPEQNAYVIAVSEGEQAAAPAAAEALPLPVLLAQASPEEGAKEAKKCAACHSEEKGGPSKIGPPLWGVIGRDIASVEGFAYSDALRGKEGQWTFENLYEFIHGPKDWAPGTKMAFAGIKSPEDRADLLVYLRTLADAPVPLPEAAAEATGTAAGAAAAPAAAPTEQAQAGQPSAASGQAAPAATAEGAEAGQQTAAVETAAPTAAAPAGAAGVGALLAHADAAAGEKGAKKCAACHNFQESGPAKIGPPLWGVVGRDIASVGGFSYSPALAGKEGAWDYQNLDAYLAEPRGWAPGTKMAFVGIKKPEERADVILYLRSLSHDPAPLP